MARPKAPAQYQAHPRAIADLPAADQASVWSAALARTRSELDAEASALIAAAQPPTPPAVFARLRSLSKAGFLLSPEVRERLSAQPLLGDVQRIDVLLAGLSFTRAVASEVDALIAGAATLTASRPKASSPRGAFTRDVLAPYAQRAMEQARARVGSGLDQALLVTHDAVFGGVAKPRTIRALRKTGDWTDFVAAVSLDAIESIGGRYGRGLAPLGRSDSMFMRVPSWHAQAARYETVAEAAEARFGPYDSPPVKGPGIHLFTAFGIPVSMLKSFLLMAGFIAFSLGLNVFKGDLLLGALSAAALYGTIVLHEFGHALAARFFGFRTSFIALHFLGGVASMERMPRKAYQEFIVAVAGPAVNLALAVAGIGILGFLPTGPAYALGAFFVLSQIFIAAFNLLIPALPMDGGRVLRSLLTMILRDHYTATRISGYLASAIAVFFAFYALRMAQPMTLLVSVFLWSASRQETKIPGTDLVEPKRKSP